MRHCDCDPVSFKPGEQPGGLGAGAVCQTCGAWWPQQHALAAIFERDYGAGDPTPGG